MSDDPSYIKVFASDDNLKSLGELLSNDSSRKIIYNLMTKEMYTNEISTKLDMRVSLVIHHLKKLEDLGLLEITEKKIKRKGLDHRFFKIKSNIFVVVNQDKADLEKQGILSKIFREGVKLASIMIPASIMWYIFPHNASNEQIKYATELNNFNFTMPLVVVVIGLIILILKKRKKCS